MRHRAVLPFLIECEAGRMKWRRNAAFGLSAEIEKSANTNLG
jgi:hypothetical protein